MLVTWDESSGAAYIYLKPIKRGESATTRPLSDDVIADYDKHGRIIGIEILGNTKPRVEELK